MKTVFSTGFHDSVDLHFIYVSAVDNFSWVVYSTHHVSEIWCTQKSGCIPVGYENHKPYPVPKSVPEFFLPSWEGIKRLKVIIISVIFRYYV